MTTIRKYKLLTANEQKLLDTIYSENYTNFNRLHLEICRKTIENKFSMLLTEKGFDVVGYPILLQQFTDIIFGVESSPSIDVLNQFVDWCFNGIINPVKLWEKDNITDCYFDELYEESNEDLKVFIDDVAKKLVKWKGKEGQKADVGDGERLITIYSTSDITRGGDKDADILFNGKQIDAKGAGSRLQGSKDISGVIAAGKVFVKCMAEITGSKHNVKDFNWNPTGLKKYAAVMKQYDCTIEQMKYPFVQSLSAIFTDVSTTKIKNFIDNCIVNNQIDPNKFIAEYSKFQIELYTEKHNLSGVFFINPSNCNIKYITDSQTFADMVDAKKFKVNTSHNWSQERNATYQYTIV